MDLSIAPSRGGAIRWLGVLALAGILSMGWACGPPDGAPEEADAGEAEEGGGEGSAEQTADDHGGRPEVPEGPPIEGFKQLMPRGGIPALYDPQFVSAAEAEIPDTAWVLGFELGGNTYAYDLNTLNYHEVVNHQIGGLPVAAVW